MKTLLTLLRFYCHDLSFSTHLEVAKEIAGSAEEPLAREQQKECRALWDDLCIEGELFFEELFARRLSKIGERGRALAAEIEAAALGERLWIDPERPLPFCRALRLLSEILWSDRLQGGSCKNRHQLAAMTLSVHRPLHRILSARAQSSPDTALVYEGKIVAQIGAVDPKLLPLVTKGNQYLCTIYHHKLLRFECRMAFENWARGNKDPQVLRFEGGETEIAEKLGFKFKDAPRILKALLHAQAYMEFSFDDASRSSLISLRDYRSNITHRKEGVEIVLSTQLMPYYTFHTDRRSRLLVPLPALPPFTSAPQYHAGQALLQMLVMEEFTQQSMEFAASGSISIPAERWQDLFYQSALPSSVFKQTMEHWHRERYLLRLCQDRYTLGELCRKELDFLRAQGAHRKERQRQGRLSSRKRKRIPALRAARP